MPLLYSFILIVEIHPYSKRRFMRLLPFCLSRRMDPQSILLHSEIRLSVWQTPTFQLWHLEGCSLLIKDDRHPAELSNWFKIFFEQVIFIDCSPLVPTGIWWNLGGCHFFIILAMKTFSFGYFPSHKKEVVYGKVQVNFLVCPGRKLNLPPTTSLFFKFYSAFHINDCSEFTAVHLIQNQTLFCLLIHLLTCLLTE